MATETQESTTTTSESESPAHGANMTTICTNEAEELNINLTGEIRLHFLRYGLLPKHNKEDWTVVSSKGVTDGDDFIELTEKAQYISEIDAINLEHFEIIRTTLHSGYLYIIDENAQTIPDMKDIYHEYQIDINGQYKWVKYKDGNIGQDIRTPEENIEHSKEFTEINEHTGKPYHKWICFSQVQWSWEYLQDMISKKELREQRMIEIHLQPFEGDSPSSSMSYPNALPYSDIQIAHSHHKESCSSWIQNILETIDSYQQPPPGHTQAPHKKRDLFITLPDPIGCLFDVTMATATEIANLRANIEAMRTGRDPDMLTYKMLNYQEQDPYSDEELKRIDMFTLAQTSYHLIFNDNETREKFGDSYTYIIKGYRGQEDRIGLQEQRGADKEKLENVLGVIERQEQRNLIRRLQNDLYLFISHDYYRNGNCFLDHLAGTPINLLDGVLTSNHPFEILVLNPRDIDRHLDLRNAFSEEEDMHLSFINLISQLLESEEDDNVYRINNEKIEFIEDVLLENWEDISNKLAGLLSSVLGIYSSENLMKNNRSGITSNIEAKFTNVRVSTKGSGGSVVVADFQEQSLQEALRREAITRNVSRIEIDQIGADGKGTIATYEYRGTKLLRRLVVDGDNLNISRTIRGVGTVASINVLTLNHTSVWANRIVNSPAFSGPLALLQIFNWSNVNKAYQEDPSAFNTVSWIGTTADLAAATFQFTSHIVRQEALKTTLGNVSAITGVIGGGITAMTSFWNSGYSFQGGDNDAGLAFAGAGVAFAMSTGAAALSTGIISVGAGLVWAGPAAWITGALAFGLYTLALYLSDSELETFFKNYSFGNHVEIALNGRKAWEYNQDLYQARMTEIALHNEDHPVFDEEIGSNRREREQFNRQLNNLRNNNNISNLENRRTRFQDAYFRNLQGFGDELAMLVNLITLNQITLKPLNTGNSLQDLLIPDTSFPRVDSRLSFTTQYMASITFAKMLRNRNQIDYKILLGPNNGRKNNQEISVTLNTPINIIPKEENSVTADISFTISDRAIQMIGSEQWHLLFLFRIDLGNGIYFPRSFSFDQGQEKYIFTTIPVSNSIGYNSSNMHDLVLNQNDSKLKVNTYSNIQAGRF